MFGGLHLVIIIDKPLLNVTTFIFSDEVNDNGRSLSGKMKEIIIPSANHTREKLYIIIPVKYVDRCERTPWPAISPDFTP